MVLHCLAEIHKAFSEIDIVWRGAYVALKPFIYLSAFIVPPKTCKLPIPYAVMHPIPSERLAFKLNADDTLKGLPPL